MDCAHWLSGASFPSAFSVLILRYSIFAHGSLSDYRYAVFVQTQWSCQTVVGYCSLVLLLFNIQKRIC